MKNKIGTSVFGRKASVGTQSSNAYHEMQMESKACVGQCDNPNLKVEFLANASNCALKMY